MARPSIARSDSATRIYSIGAPPKKRRAPRARPVRSRGVRTHPCPTEPGTLSAYLGRRRLRALPQGARHPRGGQREAHAIRCTAAAPRRQEGEGRAPSRARRRKARCCFFPERMARAVSAGTGARARARGPASGEFRRQRRAPGARARRRGAAAAAEPRRVAGASLACRVSTPTHRARTCARAAPHPEPSRLLERPDHPPRARGAHRGAPRARQAARRRRAHEVARRARRMARCVPHAAPRAPHGGAVVSMWPSGQRGVGGRARGARRWRLTDAVRRGLNP